MNFDVRYFLIAYILPLIIPVIIILSNIRYRSNYRTFRRRLYKESELNDVEIQFFEWWTDYKDQMSYRLSPEELKELANRIRYVKMGFEEGYIAGKSKAEDDFELSMGDGLDNVRILRKE